MRKAVAILLLTCFAIFAKAQGDDSGNALYPNNFTLSSPPALNNVISIPWNIDASTFDLKGTFGITVSGMYKPYFSDIKTNIAIIDHNGAVIASAEGPSFNRSDFTIGGVVYNSSTYKEFKLTIVRPNNDLHYINYFGSNRYLVIRYKYYFNPAVGIPNQEKAGWAPEVTFGREWFIHDKRYSFNRILPATTITGPKSICDNGIYTIANPGNITLENANGIANITELGDSQWKVTRIGNAVGTVILRSTSSGKVYNYPINVSSDMKGIIDGAVGIKQGWTDNYFFFRPEPGMDYTNVTWSVNSPHLITTQVDKYTFKISVPTNYPLMDTGRGDDVEIYIRSNGECGVMEKSYTLRILPARPIKN